MTKWKVILVDYGVREVEHTVEADCESSAYCKAVDLGFGEWELCGENPKAPESEVIIEKITNK